MSEERTKLEIIAPSVEEAIEKGLQDLGLTIADIDVEVLDEGKKGLLGLGTRQARVALKIKSHAAESQEVKTGDVTHEEPTADGVIDDESEEVSIARETINIILEKMHVNADVTVKLGEGDTNRVAPVLIDIEGKDLSFLIGRKAETINALQYVTSLIVGRELGRWVPLIIDIQHYRRRREEELRKLGQMIAQQVISTGRRQVLEPMSPNERRIIHIELRDNPLVETESIGEGPQRKVTVRPAE
ncbi:MAG: RNA-binding cell elongation regulator Jag/EloR [Chloroflexota bacterium]|nr:RNA-binding cell elongation regulator Jag/EloR [Chloroflexota bacterium]